jgi:hypothetical protein
MSIARLAAANPVPPADDRFDPVLFASIVARPRRRSRTVYVVALAVVACGLFATGAVAVSGWFDDVVTPGVTAREYREAQAQLAVPPGFTWPARDFSAGVTSAGGGGATAVLIAQGAWECYWTRALARGDVAAQRRAHAALLELLTANVVVKPAGLPEGASVRSDRPTVAYADDGGIELKRQMYADAAAGNGALLAQSCRVNGPGGAG